MYILGLNLIHDTSAALIKDGNIVGAIEEERLSRNKKTTDFPIKSINWLLKKANIEISDIDEIVTSFDTKQFINNSSPFEDNTIMHDDELEKNKEKIIIDNEYIRHKLLRDLEKHGITKYTEIPHHLAHAGGAYFLSGFSEANILIIDGRGESVSTSLMHGKNGEIEIIEQYPVEDSLGHLYTYVTFLCGLYSNIGQEGKTMGLAPYGKNNAKLKQYFDDVIQFNDMTYSVDRTVLRKLIKFAQPLNNINTISKDLAFHVQKKYEEALTFIAKRLYAKTGCKNFVLSGGVALNCEGNRVLLDQDYVDNIYVQPAANDGGTSLGAALYYYSTINKFLPKKVEDVYLGPSYSNNFIEQQLKLFKLKYKKVDNIYKYAANLIASNKIIAWFQGKEEFGPRALGNRSILANPSNANIKDNINNLIKYRENWRPFAPAILYEDMAEYFDSAYFSPHMTISFLVKPEKKESLISAIHIDNTARVQTVDHQSNTKFYTLLKEFKKITGIPVLLNTSFNVKGEPIVCSPFDAIRTFYSTGIDALVIGDFVIEK